MKNRSIKTLLLTLVVVIAAAGIAASQDKAANIDAVMKKFVELNQFNGSVLVADGGKIIYKKGFGLANMELGVANTPETKFRLASITKQFTAAAILQLVEKGRIKLDGKVTDYLPDYRKDTGDRVTIHQLLNHTSGIPSYTDQPNFMQDVSRDPYTPADFVKKHASGDLEFEPGSKFKYNNSAYFILGAIIEKVTGKPYAQVITENVLVPAGMTNSGYDTQAAIIKNRAAGYGRVATGFINARYLDMSLPYSAGSLYSTVGDMYLWDQALYGDKVLSAKSKELMFKPTLEHYGYGVESKDFVLSDKTTVPTIGHNGGINGFSTELVRFVKDKHVIILLDNTEGGRFQPGIVSAIANILYGKKFEMPKRSIGELVAKTITEKGIDAAIKLYRDKKSAADAEYSYAEAELNELGYTLARGGKNAEALEIFKLNVEMFPNSANPHDSLGEFYLQGGKRDLAIQAYKRALAIDPKYPSSLAALKRLEAPEVVVDAKVLEAYVGEYEIAPQFVITVSVKDGKLYGQATGQPQFTLEPIADSRFSILAVQAEIAFSKDDKGVVTGLTLYQGGREIPGKKR